MKPSLFVVLMCTVFGVNANDDPKYDVDFVGYFRAGLSASESGETQASFAAPGARAKYRLGNEADTFGEVGIDYRQKYEEGYFQTLIMLDGFSQNGSGKNFEFDGVPQLFVNAVDIIAPGIDIWVGRRYYQRMNIEINDYFWLNTAQGSEFGAGVEGLPGLAGGHWDIAILRYQDTGVNAVSAGDAVTGSVNSTGLDVRLSDIPLSEHAKISFWGQYNQRHKNTELGYDSQGGVGIGFWHLQDQVLGGRNRFSFTYRDGAVMSQTKVNARPVREDQGYDLSRSSVIEFNNDFLYDQTDRLSFQWGLIYRKERFGVTGTRGDTVTWYSSGIRPIYYFSDHVNMAIELGYDYIRDNIQDRKGSVRKATLALQLSKGRGFFSRPALRAFVTYAGWSEDFVNLAATAADGNPYADESSGWSLGLQVETWW